MSDGADASSQLVFQVGDIVAERFKIVEPIGSSEGGQSYLATETERNRRMVLKHLDIPWVGDEAYEALRAEIKQVSSIRHKNLVQVFGLGKEGEHLFLAMEYVEGQTLAAHLDGRRQKNQVMGLKAAYSVMAHLCNAVGAIHEAGSVHGALTPRNIYVTPQGRVKVTNLVYGQLVSRHLAEDNRGAYFDSPFIAPEVKEDPSAVTPAADIYSLALVVAELLADLSLQDFPGEAESFIEGIVGRASGELQELLFSAILKVPHVRPQEVKEFKAGLKQAVDAPADNQISSIVVKTAELELAAKGGEPVPPADEGPRDLFDLDDLPPPPKDDRDLFMSGEAEVVPETEGVEKEDEIWLVSKDGLDYGPFGQSTVLDMLYKDEINENTSVLNMVTQRRADLIDISEFRDPVQAYIPERDARLAREAAERERKIEQVKTGAKISTGLLVAAGVVIVGLSVFAYLQLPDPVPVEFSGAIEVFPHTFEVPKYEEVSISMDNSAAQAIFDPEASEAAKEEAWQKYLAEQEARFAAERAKRKKRRGSGRKRRNPGAGGGGNVADEEVVNEIADNDLDALDDWEVEEQIFKSFRKQASCVEKHPTSKRRIKVDFVIKTSGQVVNVKTNAGGSLDSCLKGVFRSLRFRESGGIPKRVSYPLELG